MTKFLINNKTDASFPEAALLLDSTKNCDLWVGPTPEVCDSGLVVKSDTSDENTKRKLFACSENRVAICFLVLTKTSSASRDENVSKQVTPAERWPNVFTGRPWLIT